ncbi:IclR family transcriptional regulator [Mesorhizobium sp. CGMCC 1.15528]|uniref:IclR family transcriptional regulator n=1 Tax=Mesorhizobium zhangyense TaxID=1776730 RepID=A0A7C9V5T1_9HYPH|nr:IclR family transcriptional regulator [Mesorhizobium zhangyense]NGN41485.1 IclR family transcriptional regulator [Mesorhizobium zhangyense]
MTVAAEPDKDLTGAQSVDRALKLLSLVGRQAERGMPLSEIVEQSGFNKPTTRRLLLALIRAGLVEQDPVERRYYIGEEAYVLGSLASRRYGLLQLSMESLIRISRKTEDSSFLSVRRDTYSVCLYREEGTFPIRTHALQAGFEHPLGVGAGSLAMLSALPDDEIEVVLEQNAAVLQEKFPLLQPEQLRREVAATRERGYSVNPGLIYASSWGLGIVIRFADGKLAGALSIAAIDSRMQEARQVELAKILREEAAKVEAKLVDMFAEKGKAREAAILGPSSRRSSR